MNKKIGIFLLIIAVLAIAVTSFPKNIEKSDLAGSPANYTAQNPKLEETQYPEFLSKLVLISQCISVNVTEKPACKSKDLTGDKFVDIKDVNMLVNFPNLSIEPNK